MPINTTTYSSYRTSYRCIVDRSPIAGTMGLYMRRRLIAIGFVSGQSVRPSVPFLVAPLAAAMSVLYHKYNTVTHSLYVSLRRVMNIDLWLLIARIPWETARNDRHGYPQSSASRRANALGIGHRRGLCPPSRAVFF